MTITYKYSRNILIPLLLLVTLMVAGCKKYLELNAPETKISTQNAFTNDNTAVAVLTGLYAQLSDNYIYSQSLPATSFFEELSADNLILHDIPGRQDLAAYFQNNLDPSYIVTGNQTYWTNTYRILYTINTSISSLVNNTTLTPTVQKRLLGEAYFLRAFCYFYLVNLYGEVPLILTTDYNKNVKEGRSSVSSVYSQIVKDLNSAEPLLDNNYAGLDVTKLTDERVRPNLAAVNSLLARVFLFQKNYAAAEATATKVINLSGEYSLAALDLVFLKNSSETIWALQSVNNGYNTQEAQFYLLSNDGPDYYKPVYISNSLLDSFEPGDARKDYWIGRAKTSSGVSYSYPAKYKIGFVDGSKTINEYKIVLRLAEQYLIRAEARNEQGNIVGAMDDLNAIRTRSRAVATAMIPNPLPNISSLSQGQLRAQILKERRVELFAEWGHRWFDLKRSETLDMVMTEAEKYKGGNWINYKKLYPIPLSDILLNPAISQNPGYTK